MGITKKINFESIFIFLFLAIFPFGQIIRLNFNFIGLNIPLTPLDIVAGLGALYSIFFQKGKPVIFKFLNFFLIVAAFSFAVSVFTFGKEALYGLFYLFRIFAYVYFLNYVWNFVKNSELRKKLLLNSLLVVSIASAIFGWIQFFTVPDLKPLYYIGWDMHLYRLAGTFLDPTFLGLIIVFGLILAMIRFLDSSEKKYIPVIVFLLVSLAFTYSRASYLAFLGGFFVIGVTKKKIRKIFLWVIGLVVIAFLLPTARNHSIELTRTFSIEARLVNYKEAIEVFKQSPIFGVGYNNMCVARNRYIGFEPFASHACSGSDSSLLLILATTGITGLMVFLGAVLDIYKTLKDSRNFLIIMAAMAALFIHSLFSNSLFFPWIMGYMVILLAVSTKE